MTTFIYDEKGKAIRIGRNLRLMMDMARKCKGVRRIKVERLPESKGLVRVEYHNEYEAEAVFGSYSIACEWARKKSSRQGTWWSECIVEIVSVDV